MDVREKLVEIMEDLGCNDEYCKDCEFCNDIDGCVHRRKEIIADRLIANGVTGQEWISVADKIPPDQEEVLVLTKSKNGVRNVDKGYWAIDHFIHRGRSEVTHWMPLPKPPTGE